MGSDSMVQEEGGARTSPSYVSSVPREALDAGTRALISDTQERVLRRLAMDLHDGPMQLYLAAMLQLGVLSASLPPEYMNQAEQLRDTLATAVDETYQLLDELHPSISSGGVTRVHSYVRRFSERNGIAVRLRIDGDGEQGSESLHFALLRLVQETLTNCAKHSEARKVDVSISFSPSRTILVVRDDGTGLHRKNHAGSGRGIDGMRERVELLGGSLSLESPAGGGCVVTAVIPAW